MPEPRRVHEGLGELLRAVIVHSPMEYELAGRTHKVAAFGAGQSPMWSAYSAGQPPLVVDLQTAIYDEAYCRVLGSRGEPPTNAASILEPLSAANAGRDRWEAGWSLVQTMPDGHVMARKGELAHVFAAGEYAAAHGGAPSPGAPLHVLFARESRTQQPGFYVANGETAAPFGSESRMTRIYWHVTEEGAVPLTAAVTALLNRYQVPFRFKTLAYSVYTRADAAVLYFASRYYQVVARLLPEMRAAVRGSLRAATPLLTLKLDAGIGLAEDPATGESFGMSRSRLIAQAVWDAYARGTQSEEARLMELAIQFDRAGLSLDRPHLRGGSADLYESAA
ncbi:MAG TPA: T3SS effector HopA1 family protein [Thermoanaerobaculia bacterium]|nr:T3SS effector HopA1 family protein [Thermoanaerobaculia bacterium]